MLLQNNKDVGDLFFSLIVLLTICSLLDTTAIANVRNITGVLNLSATVNNQPAFSSVTWHINLQKPGVQKLVKVLNKHTITIELEPGQYQITLSVDNKRETREVTIIESKEHDLMINIQHDS